MKSYSFPTINLLLKLSNGINILPFYGRYRECSILLQKLWKGTNDMWSENNEIFIANINYRKPRLT